MYEVSQSSKNLNTEINNNKLYITYNQDFISISYKVELSSLKL